MTELYQKRHPIYESLADIVVKTGSGHVTRVVADIMAQLIAKLSEQAASEVATDSSSINLK